MGFVYALLDPREQDEIISVRYIGVTTTSLNQRYSVHISEAKHSKKDYHRLQWVRSLLNRGIKPKIIRLDECDKEDLSSAEMAYIAYYKSLGCKLTNGTDGGEGVYNPPPEVRKKISDSRKKMSQEERESIRRRNTGRKMSPEAIEKMRQKKIGRVSYIPTDETKDKIRRKLTDNKNFLGHRHSEESRALMSAKKIGNTGRLGKSLSEEHKRKIGVGNRGENCGSAKLTWEQVREIRRKYAEGVKQVQLCREYGVRNSTMSLLLRNKTWIEEDSPIANSLSC